ncbi:MAG: carboxypeptidase regulatory-like domain-containing protein [bacterium]|nr:carboxypeptidase regulatory-like domain-containing protein [bacterium]
MRNTCKRQDGGKLWLVLALLGACLALVGYGVLVAHPNDGGGDGLQPDVGSQEDLAEEASFTLLDVSQGNQRFADVNHEQEANAEVIPVDWQGAELRAWHGLVLSTKGAEPLAKSLVEFRCSQGLVQAETDDSGQFSMQIPPGVPGVLTASHAGYLERSRPKARSGSQVSILLIPQSAILGTYDGDPTGLSADIFWGDSENSHEPIQTTELDDEGRFRFEGLAPGMYSLRARHGVHAILKNVPLGEGEERHVELTPMASSQLLGGRVVIKPGGQAVSHAEVHVGYHAIGIPKALEQGTARVETADEEGRFELGLGEGLRTSVRAVAPWGGEKSINYMDAEAWLAKGAALVEIAAAARLSGRVVDLNGKPVAGVRLELKKTVSKKSMVQSESYSRITTTDMEGTFNFGDVPSKETLIVVASRSNEEGSGRSPGQVLGLVKLGPGQTREDFILRLGLQGRLTGRVLDQGDKPFDGVILEVSNSEGMAIASTISDGLGGYSIESLPSEPGNFFVVELRTDGLVLHRETVAFPRRQKGKPEDRIITKDFRVARKSLVSGWVLDDEGYGVGSVRVYLTQKKGRKSALGDGLSDFDGSFQFLVSEPGEGKIEVALRSRAWQLPKGVSRELPNPLFSPLIIDVERSALEARAQVRGEVLVEGSASAVPRLRIQNARGGTLVTDGSRFFLTGITPGRIRLKLKANGMESRSLPSVDLTPGQNLDLGLIRMHWGCDLNLELTGTSGAKLPKGSKVRLQNLSKYEWDPDRKWQILDLSKSVKRGRRKPIRISRGGIARGMWTLDAEIPGFKRVVRKLNLKKRKANIKVKLVRK